jgi:hypothetical protein
VEKGNKEIGSRAAVLAMHPFCPVKAAGTKDCGKEKADGE